MKKEEVKQIEICDSHPEYPTPLIFTMAFPQFEVWCPYCNGKWDIFGAGVHTKLTPELQARKEKYESYYDDYLHACGMTYASGVEWNGKRIHPSELPQEEKGRLAEIRKSGYNERVEAEKL